MLNSFLTPADLQNLIGKKIKWFAPADRANADYNGVCIIKAVDLNKRQPIVSEHISGDKLDYAFFEYGKLKAMDEALCFSDGDRYLTYQILDND